MQSQMTSECRVHILTQIGSVLTRTVSGEIETSVGATQVFTEVLETILVTRIEVAEHLSERVVRGIILMRLFHKARQQL